MAVLGNDVNRVVRGEEIWQSNKGWVKINGIPIQEIKEFEITMKSNKKSTGVMNSVSQASVTTSTDCTFTLKIHKVSTRWKKDLLECAKKGIPYIIDMETMKLSPDGNEYETCTATNCIMDFDGKISSFKSDNDFEEETYTASVMLQNVDMPDIADDGIDWSI